MASWYGNGDSDKMVTHIEQGDRLRRLCSQWCWNMANMLPPGMILTSFLLFPPVLHSPFAQGTNREKASVGAAFALAACGFLPLFLLPSGALRVKLSLLGNKLCLTASVFGLMNMVIHLAYGMIRSVMLLTALALAVSQVVCYVAVIWVRVGRKGRPMPMGSVLTPRDRRDHRDRPGELLSELVLKDGGSPQERLSNLEERHIRL